MWRRALITLLAALTFTAGTVRLHAQDLEDPSSFSETPSEAPGDAAPAGVVPDSDIGDAVDEAMDEETNAAFSNATPEPQVEAKNEDAPVEHKAHAGKKKKTASKKKEHTSAKTAGNKKGKTAPKKSKTASKSKTSKAGKSAKAKPSKNKKKHAKSTQE